MDQRADELPLGPTAQDGAANREGSPGGATKWIPGRERETGEAVATSHGDRCCADRVELRAPVCPPREEGCGQNSQNREGRSHGNATTE